MGYVPSSNCSHRVFHVCLGHNSYPPFFDDSPFGIYEKILAGRIAFPAFFDPNAKDLVARLLTNDRTRRLGNLKGAAEDIKSHKYARLFCSSCSRFHFGYRCGRWFASVDWKLVERRGLTPPIVPHIQHAGDTRNFDKYPEAAPQAPCPVDFYDYFRDF